MPIREEDTPRYIMFDKYVRPKDVLSVVEKKEQLSLQFWRVVCGVMVFFGMLCRNEDRMPFPVEDEWWRDV